MPHTTRSTNVLYILGHTAGAGGLSLLPPKRPGEISSVILLQDAVSLAGVPGDHVYVLADDSVLPTSPPAYQTISYEDMVRMIFEADRVLAL